MAITINDTYLVDFEQNTVYCQTSRKQTVLGNNESMLLQYFIQHPDTTLSRKTLIDVVWASRGLVVEDGSLMQGIFLLRRAFDDSEGKLFKTERGKGYAFTGTISDQETKSRPEPGQPVLQRLMYPLIVLAAAALTYSGLYFSAAEPETAEKYLINHYSACVITLPEYSEPLTLSQVDRYQVSNNIILIAGNGESVSFPQGYQGAKCEE